MGIQLYIDPYVFSLGPITVRWYGLLIGIGLLLGLLMAIREGRRFRIPQEFFMDLLLIGLPSALIGARLYYVAFHWDYYFQNPASILAIWEGGIAILGALIGAVIGGAIYIRRKGYNFWRIADISAPSLLIGQIIGRWGNFFNQEAYGSVAAESFLRSTLHLPDWLVNQMLIDEAYRHPTFLYESLWNVLGLLLILLIRRRSFVRVGELFLGYLCWYGFGRFFIEGLRADSLAFDAFDWTASILNGLWAPMNWLGFEQGSLVLSGGDVRVSQLLSLMMVVGSIAYVIWRRLGKRLTESYNQLPPMEQADDQDEKE
jgi:phosphatidylglycerol:prolipoprotein diacylglycerol transferase